MDRCCGTCFRWNSGEVERIGTLTVRSKDPTCKMTGKIRYAEHERGCLAWKIADPWVIDARIDQGLIKEG